MTKSQTLDHLQKKLSGTVIKTQSQAIASGFPSVGKLKATHGDTVVKALLVDMLADFIEFINVGKTFSGLQIAQTVAMIQQYFPHFNLGDLKLFFERMKLGHYGSFYDRMDGQIVLSKMEQYNQDRMNEYQLLNDGTHNNIRREEKLNSALHPSVIEAMKKAVGEKVVVSKDPPKRQPNDADLFYQRCIRQFDNLYRKFGVSRSGLRTLYIGGRFFMIDDFIERKVQNAIK